MEAAGALGAELDVWKPAARYFHNYEGRHGTKKRCLWSGRPPLETLKMSQQPFAFETSERLPVRRQKVCALAWGER